MRGAGLCRSAVAPASASAAMTQIVSCVGSGRGGNRSGVFLFFSNRLGCLGSLAVSAVVTLVLLFLLGVFR